MTGTLKSYIVGFVLSLLLTLAAYFAVANHLLAGGVLIATIVVLGLVQAVVQLLLFLHLSEESKPRERLHVFLFALLVVAIVVFGSLWIMQNLNYHVMST